ncbi:MAG: acyl carrier protein [Actinomycetota bacterium]
MAELERVTEIVCRVGGLPALSPDENIYRAGFASLRALELLVELETEYDVTIDDERFMQAQSARELAAMLTGPGAAA